MCKSKYVEVECKTCGKHFSKRKDTLNDWKGECRPCNNKTTANLPHVKEMSIKRSSGSNSHFWKGGVTTKNMKIRCSTRYRKFRKSIMERDNYTCQFCKVRGGKLHVDHIKPFCNYPELRFEGSNCRTLCVPCHRSTPTWGINQFTMKGAV